MRLYFLFLLLKQSLKVRFLAALSAGLYFSLYFQEANNDQWTGFAFYDGLAYPGLPLVLFSLSNIERLPVGGAFGLLVLIAVVISLGSHIMLDVFFIPLWIFWFLYVDPRRSKVLWLRLGLMIATFVLITLPMIWALGANE